MKTIYWRPHRLGLRWLLLLAGVATAAIATLEWRAARPPAVYPQMLAAAQRAERCFALLKEERLRRGVEIVPHFDPAESGLIGIWMSPVTSVYGNLHAKQTSVNPNFAALVVRLLHEAGVKTGDVVAVGFSGSFPALNTCVCAALTELGVKPVIITSVAASQWGANLPGFLWVDMEASLVGRKLIDAGSVAASIGGREDRGEGMSAVGIQRIRDAIAGHGIRLIEAPTYTASVDRRMAIYAERAGAAPIKAYVNVGGGTVSVGSPDDKRAFEPGLSYEPPDEGTVLQSVMARFAERGVPIVHLSQVHELARHYRLPRRPASTPRAGQGTLYASEHYDRGLAVGLLAVLAALLAFLHRRSRRPVGEPGPNA